MIEEAITAKKESIQFDKQFSFGKKSLSKSEQDLRYLKTA